MTSRRLPCRRSLAALRSLAVTSAVVAAAAVLAACGSDSAGTSPPEGQATQAAGQSGLLENRLISSPASVFTMDDLVAAGYKKSKQFATDTLPHATDVWYGFFNQKDIEVRVYESHKDALDFGVEPAEAAVAKEAGQTDYLIPVVNRYPAYAVFGNLVMLCERELKTCEALIDELAP